jgi:DNA-directed RNA polymerase specialized sigma24 family protein
VATLLERKLLRAAKIREGAELAYREAIREAIESGMTYRQVAEILEVSPGSVHTLLHGRSR